MNQIIQMLPLFMQTQLFWVLFFLSIAILLFVTDKVSMDLVGLLVIIAFTLSGILTLPEALTGFSDPNVILIACLFVIGEGLVRTGVAYQVGDWLVRVAGNNEMKMLILLMLAVAGLGSIMSSTGVVAIFIPVVMSVCSRQGIAPGHLMMPLGFSGLISGMMTLVATAPNLVVNAELARLKLPQFKFFSITPIGITILILGILYMLILSRWFGKNNKPNPLSDGSKKHTMRDLIREYKLSGRERRFSILPTSPLIGKRLDELQLRTRYGANIIGIERTRRFRKVMISAFANTELLANDTLLVDISNSHDDIVKFYHETGLEPLIIRGDYFSEKIYDMGMAEISLTPESKYLGKTIRQITFRTKFNLNIIGFKRQGDVIDADHLNEELQLGDTLLVIGNWRQIRLLQTTIPDFYVISLPAEVNEIVPARSQAPHAIFSLITMVFLMVFVDAVPNMIAAMIACLMMAKFRCINAESAYRSIHWPSLLLIIGMLPFAIALQKTGGIDLVVNGLMSVAGGSSPRVMLAILFLLCSIIGLFISNTATAVLMAPIAIASAQQMNVSILPFAMTIMISASSAFMTPVSSPVNTMVFNPGGYKFMDFVKVGVPFTILVMVVSIIIIPLLFPF